MDTFTIESDSIKVHLNFLQSIISRMASNCFNIKAWTVTIISAIIVLLIEKQIQTHIWITLIPLIIFLLLDAYYLSLEKCYRNLYNDFIKRLHTQKLEIEMVYQIKSPKFLEQIKYLLLSLISPSIWLFYSLFFIVLALVIYFI